MENNGQPKRKEFKFEFKPQYTNNLEGKKKLARALFNLHLERAKIREITKINPDVLRMRCKKAA
jgi:hypothetical protein